MYEFTYHRPTSLDEAKALFARGAEASYISGGHTLLPALKQRLAAPSDLIDLTQIREMRGIALRGDDLLVGGGMTHAEVGADKTVEAACSTLAALARSIGDAHVRHRGTLGGSVANNDPAADYPAAVLALNGTVHTDQRQIPADQFFTSLYETALSPGEIVVGVSFKVPETSGYAKFRNPASRYPMAGVFVARHKDGSVRVAVTGAGNEGVFRWSEAEARLKDRFAPEAVDGLTVSPGRMLGDIHGSQEYRANLVAVMAKRALQHLGTAEAII